MILSKLKLQSFLITSIILFFINSSYGQDTIDIPDISVQRGFFESPFNVTITSNREDAYIVYTLDGSDPASSESAFTEISPATIFIDPENETGRFTSSCVVLRVIEILEGFEPSKTVTHTYIFKNKIKELSPHELSPGTGWPDRNMDNSSKQYIDYGLDPEILNDSRYMDEISEAFFSLPSISLVTDLENLFDPDSGIYVNADKHGVLWEKPVSFELLNFDESPDIQINAGLRIRGGWGRRNENPKHAFRLFFREKYGASKFEYPLFGDEGINKFDKIDLRTSQNYSWAAEGSNRNTLVREVLSRDIQRDMGQPYTRSKYYHLYINGIYWGIYQTQERAEASYAEEYFGGSKDDYDVIKVDIGENRDLYEIEATDGNLDAYYTLWEMASNGFTTDDAYYKVEGKNPDGTRNPQFDVLLDIDNLIDYLLCTYYVADGDGPLTGTQKPNNFYAIYNRENPEGFKFFRHDAEHSLINKNANLTGSVTGGEEFRHFNPRWLNQRLAVHPEYRLRLAERIYKHFTNNGACTDEVSINRLNHRKSQIENAIVAQSARWGDSKSDVPRTKDDDWIPAINFMRDDFFPGRTSTVIQQYKDRDWYPKFSPPRFNIESGIITDVTEVTLYSPIGNIYYTLDGTDPRLPESITSESRVSSNAIEYNNAIEISKTTNIKSRTLYKNIWGVLNEITLTMPQGFDELKVTEIHYHPIDMENTNDSELEFIEIKNVGKETLNLNGLNFFRGITYTFPDGTEILSGEYLVLASNSIEFEKRYGFQPFDEFVGQLANSGETISLQTANNDTLITIKYNDKYPWPNSADGSGYSLVLKEENILIDLNDASNWHASKMVNGSPGENDNITDIEEYMDLPTKYLLSQNYPNPFNPSTKIEFYLPKAEHVTIEVYNTLGQQIVTLVNKPMTIGQHQIELNGRNLSSGVYFYRIEAGSFVQAKKMIILR